MTALLIVHASAEVHAQARKGSAAAPITGRGEAGLPAPVADMREAVLEAARSGRIEELRVAVELNELKPAIGDNAPGSDPIEALRGLSRDGSGHDVLAALEGILAAPWIAVPTGPDIENSRIYVWPRYAETGIQGLTPEDEADLTRLAPPDALARMRATGVYDGLRLGIGVDGTWHYLRR